MNTNTTHTIKVPKSFWDDHKDRDCVDTEVEVRTLTKHYVLTMQTSELLELLSDANHYAESAGEYGWDAQWLVSSARATRAAIIKQIGTHALLTYLFLERGIDIADADDAAIHRMGWQSMGRAFDL